MKPRNPWIELMGTVAHDLNTPITVVKGNIELVQNAGPLTDMQMQFSERALSSLRQMEQLVQLLLDVAWVDADKPLHPVECSIAEMIQAAVTMQEDAARRRSITIEVDVADDTGVVLGDRNRLPQVFNNLLNNAIKYNRQGGTVWLSARGDGDSVRITVRDNGRGVPAQDLPRVFDAFYRADENSAAKIEGTGLGLSVVKGVVDKHGGQITVESEPDQGTTFQVTLPRDPTTVQPSDTPGETADEAAT